MEYDLQDKCLECGSKLIPGSIRSLGNHLMRQHKSSEINTTHLYLLKHFYKGEVPLCTCGCGRQTEWHNTKYRYNRFIAGHNDTFTSENQPIYTPKQIQ